jgi:excisionase family DNA binding protein
MQSNPMAFKVNEACSVAGVGRTSIYDAITTGELRAVKRGKSTLILADDLRRWLESLPAFIPKNRSRNEAPPCGDQNATGPSAPTAKKITDDENVLHRPSVRHQSVRKPTGAPKKPPRPRGRPRVSNSTVMS